MKSPFPGLDPYLETHWRDVHSRLMVYISDHLQERLPSSLRACVEETVAIELDEDARRYVPDVHVVENPAGGGVATAAVTAVSEAEAAEPWIVRADDVLTERHIEIIETSSGRRVVTVIEVLSPSNKLRTDDRTAYRRKQRDYRRSGVNLVEIDLVRGGEQVLPVTWESLPMSKRRPLPFMICVSRTGRGNEFEVYGATLHERLPAIRIPLRLQDADVVLNLQQMIDLCYQRGRYASLDYQRDPEPPLSPDDARWADELLRAAGRRMK